MDTRINKLIKIMYCIIALLLINFIGGCTEKPPIVINNSDYEIVDPIVENGILPVDNTWVRDESRNVITNFTNMYQADVTYEKKSKYPFKMWFFGWASDDANSDVPGCDAIYHARSKDMKVWEIYMGDNKWDDTMNPKLWKPVVYASDNYYDNYHNGDPSVVAKDGKYYMAYSAYGKDKDGIGSWEAGDTDGDLACIMGAISDDGINWTKTSAPILVWKDEIGVDESKGQKNGTNYGYYHRPSLMWDDGKWKLWFDYWGGTANGLSMGYAENSGDYTNVDSWSVVRADKNPLIKQWPNPDVIKVGSLYYCFADPMVALHKADSKDAPWTGWPARQIAEAMSKDGINWTITGWLKPDSDSAANQIPQAFLLDDTLYLWYATQIGGEPYDFRYDNIRYMTKKVN